MVDALSGAALMAGWSADAVSYAYGVWTCQQCKHMFTWQADRACPKCGTLAPHTYENPEMESYGGLLEDVRGPEVAILEDPVPELPMLMPASVPLPPVPGFPAGANVYDLEVIPHGTDAAAIAGLRSTIEQMGAYLVERDGRYFVATINANYMRFALVQQGYVQSVI